MSVQSVGPVTAERFPFGKNWGKFVDDVDDARICSAERTLASALGDLSGRSFLDVGCGSGLFSLAAMRLGAVPVRSFDYDSESVAATQALRACHGFGSEWTIESGDVTDGVFMASLGVFDIVYAWGVLHHTGAMWRALDLTIDRVAPGGVLFIAIYNDQGPKSNRWRAVKRMYNRLPRPLQNSYALTIMVPGELRMMLRASAYGELPAYFREWTGVRDRGMSRWHDLLDWVGGYPFEVAKPEEVFEFCRRRGLELRGLTTCGGGLGCNQFVFRRAGAG
jgi:2-polyprenyl-3-methyl-5-hydroxy-6-metoxy-1,4-benzoquinol methylase